MQDSVYHMILNHMTLKLHSVLDFRVKTSSLTPLEIATSKHNVMKVISTFNLLMDYRF